MTSIWPPLGGIKDTVLQPGVTEHLQVQMLPSEDVCLVTCQIKADIHIVIPIL